MPQIDYLNLAGIFAGIIYDASKMFGIDVESVWKKQEVITEFKKLETVKTFNMMYMIGVIYFLYWAGWIISDSYRELGIIILAIMVVALATEALLENILKDSELAVKVVDRLDSVISLMVLGYFLKAALGLA